MAATTEVFTPTVGESGEPCASCATPLAVDQRYCLECGTRRGEARVSYRDLLPGAGVPPGAAAGGEARPRRGWRAGGWGPIWGWSANSAVITGVGCLLLAMGIGVLIGRSGNDNPKQAAAPAPQVIRVSGGGAADTGSASTGASASGGASSKASKKSTKHKKGSNTASSAAASKTTNPTIKNLDKLSPKDYQKQSAKLPKQVGTGGKAPPVDKSKPAGAGSSSQTIG